MSQENHQVSHSSVGYQPRGSSSLDHREADRVERMAGRMIEQAMTSVVVRICWNCRRRFVKTVGCSSVTCVCGANTCYRCGGQVGDRHKCQIWLPEATRRSIRQAAWAAKRHLRHRYPDLKFKYDPSRRFSRSRNNRRRWKRFFHS